MPDTSSPVPDAATGPDAADPGTSGPAEARAATAALGAEAGVRVDARPDDVVRDRAGRGSVATVVALATLAGTGSVGTAAAADGPVSQPRIIGGERVAAAELPWMAALVGREGDAADTHFCGGSLIAPEWVLTAAHCVEDVFVRDVDVLLGVTDLADPGAGERIEVIGSFVPPDYRDAIARGREEDAVDDIALLRLARPSTATPIALARGDQRGTFPPGTPVLTSGWGNRSTTGFEFSTFLHAAELTVSDEAACDAAYGAEIAEGFVCASSEGGLDDSCQGDSGGPLSAMLEGEPVLVGVVSFGEECGSETHPGAYTRVGAFESFVAASLDARYALDVRARFEPALPGEIARAMVEIHHLGDAGTLDIAGVRFEDGTGVSSDGTGCAVSPLAPGERCTITLEWQPTVQRALDDAMLVDVFDGVANTTNRVALGGIVLDPFPLADALDLPSAGLFEDGEITWRLVTDGALDGDTAVAAEGLLDIPDTSVLVASVPGGGAFGFAHRGRNVTLRVFVDGVLAETYESGRDWRRETIELEGPARVRWELFGAAFPSVFELDALSLAADDMPDGAPIGPTASGGGGSGAGSGLYIVIGVAFAGWRRRATRSRR